VLKIFREYFTDFVTALHTIQGGISQEISVRPSVCQMREL